MEQGRPGVYPYFMPRRALFAAAQHYPASRCHGDQSAAHALISLDNLLAALRVHESVADAADELWVDAATLRTRLDHLHPSERAYLRRHLIEEES